VGGETLSNHLKYLKEKEMLEIGLNAELNYIVVSYAKPQFSSFGLLK
jgi:hypothetical protein